jgi:hypothetical protein
MPRNLPHYTTCAPLDGAYQYSFPTVLTILLSGGVVGYFLALRAGLGCDPYTLAAIGLGAIILVAALGGLETWFYTQRLMCLKPNQCVIGTLVGKPTVGCDGDRKLDLLLAPFGFHEVDRDLMSAVINQLAGTTVDGQLFPPAGPNVASDRAARLSYVEGLSDTQRRLLYLELLQNHMLNQTSKAFQSRFYRKEAQAVSPDQLVHIPDDNAGLTSSNPMFRYDGDGAPDAPLVKKFFCWLVGEPADDPLFGEDRLVPYLHCEIEGDLTHRGIFNLRMAILGFAAAYAAVCLLCDSVTLGAGTFLCAFISLIVSYLFSWWLWFFLSLFFNNLDESDAGSISEVPIPLPDPNAPDDNSVSARGDLVLAYGDWVKDTEHTEWFEIHPIKAWYLISRDADNGPVLQDDPNIPAVSFDARAITQALRDEMCQMVSNAESAEPLSINSQVTSAALSMAGGLAE